VIAKLLLKKAAFTFSLKPKQPHKIFSIFHANTMVWIYILTGIMSLAILMSIPIFISVTVIFTDIMPVIKIELYGVKIFEKKLEPKKIKTGGGFNILKAITLRHIHIRNEIFAADLTPLRCSYAAMCMLPQPFTDRYSVSNVISNTGKSSTSITVKISTSIWSVIAAL
jgi:hypothetical protein